MWLQSTTLGRIALIGWLLANLANTAAADPITPPGSRIGLEPPKGFAVASTFTGFLDQRDNASILLVEFPPIAFKQISAGLNAEAMAKHGLRLLSHETIEGLPYEQVTVRAEQSVGSQLFDKWMMTINGPDVVGMVTISVPKPAPSHLSDAVIRASLASVRFSATTSVNPIAPLPFTIEPAARFKYRQPMAGRGLLLKETPPPPEGQLNDVSFITTLAGDTAIAPSDQPSFGEREFLASKAINDKVILSTKPVTTPNATGFEYLA